MGQAQLQCPAGINYCSECETNQIPIMDVFLETIYAVQKPNRTRSRDKPFSIICCGMPRTGTDSLAKALTTLGYEGVYHGSLLPSHPGDCAALATAYEMKERKDPAIREAAFWDKILGDYQAIADLPAATYVAELMDAYPEAKIVLNMRDVDAWKISMRRALGFYLQGRRYFELFDTNAFWMRRYTETNNDPMYHYDFEANAEQVYRDHCAMVRRIVPKERLLEWYVEDGWRPLCSFLGKAVPEMDFPYGNATAAIVPRLEARTRMLKRKAWWQLIAGGGLLSGLLVMALRDQWFNSVN